MRWAFWRSDGGGSDGDRPARGGREATDADQAAQLRARTRRRLVGAAALLLAAVIVVPMLLDATPRPIPETVSITTLSAPMPIKSLAEAQPQTEGKGTEPVAAAVPVPPIETPVTASSAKPAVVPPAKPAAETAAAERYALQVAALSSQSAAGELAARLKKGGYAAYVEPVGTAEGTRYRVRVGPFNGRAEAQRAGDRLKAAGHSAVLIGL